MLCLNVTHGCTPGKRQELGTVWECKSVIIAWHAFLKACCVLRGMKQLWRHTMNVCVCVCVPVLAGFQAFILKIKIQMVACHWEWKILALMETNKLVLTNTHVHAYI